MKMLLKTVLSKCLHGFSDCCFIAGDEQITMSMRNK